MTWWIGSNARCGRGQRGRYWGVFQYVPRSKLVCTGADSNSAVRAFVGSSLYRGQGPRGKVEEVQALVYASMAGDARVVNDVTIPDNFRLLHARE